MQRYYTFETRKYSKAEVEAGMLTHKTDAVRGEYEEAGWEFISAEHITNGVTEETHILIKFQR